MRGRHSQNEQIQIDLKNYEDKGATVKAPPSKKSFYHFTKLQNELITTNWIIIIMSSYNLSYCLLFKFFWYTNSLNCLLGYYVCMCWDSEQEKIIESVEGGSWIKFLYNTTQNFYSRNKKRRAKGSSLFFVSRNDSLNIIIRRRKSSESW